MFEQGTKVLRRDQGQINYMVEIVFKLEIMVTSDYSTIIQPLLSIYLSHLPVHISIYLTKCIFIHLSIYLLYLYLFIYLYFFPSNYLYFYLSNYQLIYIYINLFSYLSIHLTSFISIYLCI